MKHYRYHEGVIVPRGLTNRHLVVSFARPIPRGPVSRHNLVVAYICSLPDFLKSFKHTYPGKCLGDHQLRHVYLVLKQIRYCLLHIPVMVNMTTYLTLIDSLFGPFDVSVDQHFMQTGLNDGRDKTAVITSHCLDI